MKRSLATIAAVLLAAGMCISPSYGAIGISINIGDQPYYEGPSYWDSGYEFIWVPGYEHHHHWVHGHYVRHGEFHREHANEHHHFHHHDDHNGH